MPTHKTRTTQVDAVQYDGSNDAEIVAFLGNELYFDDGPVWFPENNWAVGVKVVWINPSWRALNPNDWLVKSANIVSVWPDEEFTAVYESV